MNTFPDTEKKLKARISSYKSSLNQEKKEYGVVSDGSGKRYLLFWLYFLLNDLAKSNLYFEWYKSECSDDSGEPIQKLCWALSLYRMGKSDEAKFMLAELMLDNIYMIPKLLKLHIEKQDIWHSSNYAGISYAEDLPDEIRNAVTELDLAWIQELYSSFEFQRMKKRHIEIYNHLQSTDDFDKRRSLLQESCSLLGYLTKNS
ncbi:hypothetical protein [uncultured Psychromonas sp.]|uniref:hypothetical protein n=1 Tax=uncultured Psychromonas sp. TaxID=173974 RepID=UPI0026300EE7|nr:hypothetical protein [uncultured Psychromonas sp.]